MKRLFLPVLFVVILSVFGAIGAQADFTPSPLNSSMCSSCGGNVTEHGACACPEVAHIGGHNSGANIVCTPASATTCGGCATPRRNGGCGRPMVDGRCFLSVLDHNTIAPDTAHCGCTLTGVCPPCAHVNCNLRNNVVSRNGFMVENPLTSGVVKLGVRIDHHWSQWGSGMQGIFTNHRTCVQGGHSAHLLMDPEPCVLGDMHCHLGPNGSYHDTACANEFPNVME